MNINIIGVPLNYGCDREGVQFGPSKLRELGMIEALESDDNDVYDMGNIKVDKYTEDMKYNWHEHLKYLNPIVDINRNLAHSVYCSLKAESFPLIVGGDHSLGMGSIAGASKYFKRLAVIWIDAHGDINTSDTSPTGNIHGMPLAASLGSGHPLTTNLYYEGDKVQAEDVYIIGARDLDPGEINLANARGINLITMDKLRQENVEDIIKSIIEEIQNKNVDGVHLSFDIDSIDKDLVPGTGTPVKDGFKVEEVKNIFNQLFKTGFITSMDFVEFNPSLDENNKTAEICLELMSHLGNIIK